jgi:hypothetical protein
MQELENKLSYRKLSLCRITVKTIEKILLKMQKKIPTAFFLYANSKCKMKDGISDLKVNQRDIL